MSHDRMVAQKCCIRVVQTQTNQQINSRGVLSARLLVLLANPTLH